MKTRITTLLGIDVPVIQGGMAWIAEAHLAAAVSNAGGVGLIAAGAAPVEWVEEQIDLVRTLTDRPFGVNIMLMNPNAAQIAALLAEKRVPVITSGAGSPGKYMESWKEAGCIVMPVVASTALAKRMERAGADAIVAEGSEAGGHIGELTTMALVPQVVDSVCVPVVAAGGIADGRGMAAAFMLGAEGVQMGTRFLVAEECRAADAYKDKVLGAKDVDTIVTGRSTGHPVRGLKNPFARSMKQREDEGIEAEEFERLAAGSLRRAVFGDVDAGSVMAGQCAGLVDRRQSTADILHEVVSEANRLLSVGPEELFDLNARREGRCRLDG